MAKKLSLKYPNHSILTTKNSGHTWIGRASLRNPGLFRVLTPEEERRIFVKINKSVRRVLGVGPRAKIKWNRAKMDEAVILRAMKKSERSLVNRVVLRNMRLVLTVAKKFNHVSLTLEDLLHFGVPGLVTAILRFEPSRGLKFSTYAVFWLRHSIGRDLCNLAEVVRTPVYTNDNTARIKRCTSSLIQKLGRIPTDEELAEASGLALAKIRKNATRKASTFSLNAVAAPKSAHHAGEMMELQDLYANTDILDAAPHAGTEISIDSARVWQIAESVLSRKEKAVLELRFVHGLTLEQVAKDPRMAPCFGHHFPVSRERVRQLQDRAFAKIRSEMREHDRMLVARE